LALTLPRRFIDEMIAHARDELPAEACGMISGSAGVAKRVYRIRNAADDAHKHVRYVMDDKEVLHRLREMDAEDASVLVIYHSHVASPAYPSPTDVRLAFWPQSDPPVEIFPDAYYVLVSLKDREHPDVRAYTIAADGVTEVPIEAEP
jgi:proteasome lid subunit RPN8/RPN11